MKIFNHMKRFLSKIVIFLLGLVLFFIPPLLVLKCTGESYTSLRPIIENNDHYLIGYAYNDDAYKFL